MLPVLVCAMQSGCYLSCYVLLFPQLHINSSLPRLLLRPYACYAFGLPPERAEGRGGVEVKCVSGCKCEPQTFDSSHTERVSITKIYEFPVGGGVAAAASRRVCISVCVCISRQSHSCVRFPVGVDGGWQTG